MRKLALLAVLLLPLASGCSAYMPTDDDPRHLAMDWRPTFEKAARDAKATGKPILLVAAAGDLRTSC